jgi:hypothetical protein
VKKSIIVIEDFYDDTEKILNIVKTFKFAKDEDYFKGYRSRETYRPNRVLESFENILQEKINIKSWQSHPNGCFQLTSSLDPTVYHIDSQMWAGVLFFSPQSNLASGTLTHRNIVDGCTHRDSVTDQTFKYGFYDSTQFETVDSIGNIFNRLVLFDAGKIHSAGPYWGREAKEGRLVQLFFFNLDT